MTENEFIKLYLKNMASNMRLFRINAGSGWTGKDKDIYHYVKNGIRYITIKNPRILHAAPPGWPDLAGWEEIEITDDMIGQKIAVFTGKEFKMTGYLSKIQKKFRDVLRSMGGNFETVKPKY